MEKKNENGLKSSIFDTIDLDNSYNEILNNEIDEIKKKNILIDKEKNIDEINFQGMLKEITSKMSKEEKICFIRGWLIRCEYDDLLDRQTLSALLALRNSF